jgi:isopenicillin-N epimerase
MAMPAAASYSGDLTREWSSHWTLDPAVTFLNHGSFGACPRPVLEEQARLRTELERQPVRFLWRTYQERLDAARAELAGFVGAEPQDLVFVNNATTGVNAVLRSLPLLPGEELLVTDHEYNATRNAVDFVARRTGAAVVVVHVPFPLASPDEVVEAVLAAITPRTRLAVLDHVTSPTGLVLPVAELAAALAERGVELLVDGAHGPGMLPLQVPALGVTYYTGNCHKWLCAPKGAAFLWVRRDRQAQVRPCVISHGANQPLRKRSRFQMEFDWTGTDDPTAWLVVPAAIRFLGALLPGGWPELMARNHALAQAARRLLCEVLGAPGPCPESMLGSLASVPLPDLAAGTPLPEHGHDPLNDLLEREYGIVAPVIFWPSPPRRLLRVSAQAYNTLDQYHRLAEILPQVIS